MRTQGLLASRTTPNDPHMEDDHSAVPSMQYCASTSRKGRSPALHCYLSGSHRVILVNAQCGSRCFGVFAFKVLPSHPRSPRAASKLLPNFAPRHHQR